MEYKTGFSGLLFFSPKTGMATLAIIGLVHGPNPIKLTKTFTMII